MGFFAIDTVFIWTHELAQNQPPLFFRDLDRRGLREDFATAVHARVKIPATFWSRYLQRDLERAGMRGRKLTCLAYASG